MSGAKAVKIAFTPFSKSIKPVALPDFPDFVTAARENLVGVGLVADIPDHPVFRRFEDIMQGHSKLDNAKPCAKMPTRYGCRINSFSP